RTARGTVVLVSLSERHRDITPFRRDRRNRFDDAGLLPPRFSRASPRDLLRCTLDAPIRRFAEVAGDCGEPLEPRILGNRACHVPTTGAHADTEHRDVGNS